MARRSLRRAFATVAAACIAAISVSICLTGGSYALWNASATVSGATITAGSIGATMSGFTALTTTFNSNTTTVTAPVVFGNTGTVAATYTATSTAATTAAGPSALASAVKVMAWPLTATSTACTADTVAPAGAAASTWASMPALTGTIPAHSSVTYCMRATLPQTASVASPNSITVTQNLQLTRASWTSSATQSATQTYTYAPPASPVTCTPSGYHAILLSWPAGPTFINYNVIVGGVQYAGATNGYNQILIQPYMTQKLPIQPTTVTIIPYGQSTPLYVVSIQVVTSPNDGNVPACAS